MSVSQMKMAEEGSNAHWLGAMNKYVMSENSEAAQSGLGPEGKTKQWEKRLEGRAGARW